MEILLIGNGFDLEHDLPTTYSQFLDFCMMVEEIFDPTMPTYKNYEIWLQKWEPNEFIQNALLTAFKQKRSSDAAQSRDDHLDHLIDKLHACFDDNLWIKHFQITRSCIGQNWIDFESEISRVIQALDAARPLVVSEQPLTSLEKEAYILFNFLCEKANISPYKKSSVNQLTQLLSKDLDRLIRAFEIYIAGFVGRIPINAKSPDIENIHPDCLLSFNYSDTYQRVYDPDRKIKYDYIHGKADIGSSVKTCSLVLGIDEYLDDARKDIDLQFLSFKKYYQRIYKGTDSTYLDWIGEIREENERYDTAVECFRQGKPDPYESLPFQKRYYPTLSSIPISSHTLYIFGHSLDVTDKDILRALICNDHVKTVIYYHRKTESDKTALGQLIHNLVKIIGQEELIRRTGGSNRSIEFVPQTIRDTGTAPAASSSQLTAVL